MARRDYLSGGARSAFAAGNRLRILADFRSLDPTDEALDLVLGFVHHELVDAYSVEPRAGFTSVELGPVSEHRTRSVKAGARHTVLVDVWQWEEVSKTLGPELDVDPTELERQLVVAQLVEALECDLLLTGSELLGGKLPAGLIERANAATPSQTAAIVGLYLRSRGEFVVDKSETHEQRLTRGLFYWLLTRAVLPAGWPWFSACVHSSHQSKDEDRALLLGQSALARIGRAFRARDRLLEQAQHPPNEDAADEALFQLDIALLMLTGAFDASARVAHLAYRLPGSLHDAGWRRAPWIRGLARLAPELAESVAPESARRDVLDLIGLLRNTIHGEGLQGFAFREVSRPLDTEHLVHLPRSSANRLRSIVERRGGLSPWGIREIGSDVLALSADDFVERLLPESTTILDQLMADTDVGLLAGVDPADLSEGPPGDDYLFSPELTRNVLLLAGQRLSPL